MEDSAAKYLFLRFLVYAALIAGTFQWMVVAVQSHGARYLVRDDGPIEITQFLAALCTALLFWLLSRERVHSADLLRFLSALSLIACARELDNFTLELGSRDAYKWIAVVPLAWALFQVARARGRLLDQLAVFSRTSGFSLLLAGFLVVVVYSQLLGQKALWLAVLDADTYRPVKDLVEESSELLGYLLMLFGAAEATLDDQAD
ncbi:MAG: hypothetical protein ABR587_14005 [Candidatus Binatia bacterium]